MITKPHQIFRDALEADYAIGAFNTSNMEVAQGIGWAANAQNAPVIIQTSEGAVEYAGLKMISNIIKAVADDIDVPVIMHLDHGESVDTIHACIDAGYTSVMIDASEEDIDGNIRKTRKVVDYAHDRGVWVEAELGAIMGKEGARELKGGRTPEEFFTQPEQAERFITETGVDALAVSVGTIHGSFSGQEYIRFELLEKVQNAVPDVPLVLHGASGISDKHLQRATAMNVCKVNVDTEMRIAFEDAVQGYVREDHTDVDPRKMLDPAREAVQQVVEHKIKLFGSDGVASVY